MEIRPINAGEQDAFLRLLCEVFDLDFGRASTVFFHEPYFDLKRKWALFEGDQMVTILTTVPLSFGWGEAIGIAGVATRLQDRGRGMAGCLIEHVTKAEQPTATFLFAKDPSLYRRLGFEVVGEVIRANFDVNGAPVSDTEFLSLDEVRATYNGWAKESLNRLIRDERRWQYWSWNLRSAAPLGDGYVCVEHETVREVIPIGQVDWASLSTSEFFGLRNVAISLDLPLMNIRWESHLMALGASESPELFLTDQF